MSASSSVPRSESTNASSASVQRRQRLQRPHVPQRGRRLRMEVGGARSVWRPGAGANLATSFPDTRGRARPLVFAMRTLPGGSALMATTIGRPAQRRGARFADSPGSVWASAFERRPVVTAGVPQECVWVKSNDRRNLVRLSWDKAKEPVVQIEVGGHPATGAVDQALDVRGQE